MAGHRHKDSRLKWTTTDPAEAHPADALTQAEVDGLKALLAAPGGGGGTTPIPNPPPPPPPPDITPPIVSGVTISGVGQTSASVTWTTNEATTGVVEYGPTGGPYTTTGATSSGTSHSRSLTGLSPGVTYQLRVKATDTAGNLTVDAWRSFTTAPIVTPPGPTVPPGLASGSITLQEAIDAAAAGSVMGVPAGRTWNEQINVTKALSIVKVDGAASWVDGQNTRYGIRVRASDVTILDLGIRNTVHGSSFEGALDVRSTYSRCTYRGHITNSAKMDVYVQGGSGHRISGEIDNCGWTGVHIHEPATDWFCDALIHDCAASADSGEGAGLKALKTWRGVIDGAIAHHNTGAGFWLDGFVDCAIRNSQAYRNTMAGIMWEAGARGAQTGCTLSHNWEGQAPGSDTFFTGETRVDSCNSVSVKDGILAFGISGATFTGQDRVDGSGVELLGGTRLPYNNHFVTGNVITQVTGNRATGTYANLVKVSPDPIAVSVTTTPNEVVAGSDPRVSGLP